jgi:fatty acid desaturase
MTTYDLPSAKETRFTALEAQVKNLSAQIATHEASIQNKKDKIGACGIIIFAYCASLWMSVKVAAAAGDVWVWMWLLFSCVMTVVSYPLSLFMMLCVQQGNC